MEAMQRTHHRRALVAATTQSPSGSQSVKRPKGGTNTERALISIEASNIFSFTKLCQVGIWPR